jgi:hypothetical protein
MVRLSSLVRSPATVTPAPEQDGAASVASTDAAVRAIDLVRGPRVGGPGGAADAATAPPSAPAPPSGPRTGTEATRVLADLQRFLTDVRDRVRGGSAPSWLDFEGVIRRAVASLAESAELFWLANAAAGPSGADELVVHHTRVAILAVRIGLDVGYDPARAAALGMAGGLIDVSLWESSGPLLHRLDALSPAEEAMYRSHPLRSAALLARWNASPSLVETVLQHHEREGGQGFPRQLAGPAIGEDAKIVGLVDAYASRATPSSRRPGLRPHEAIREIVRSKQESFPPALVKALLSEISVFPPGTLVRLNTGEIGQVVAVNRNHPLRPRIDVVVDAKGQRPALAKAIDLSETPFLYITGPVSASS